MSFETDKTFIELRLNAAENTNTMLAYWGKDLVCKYANKAYMYWFGIEHTGPIDKKHIRELLGPLYQQNLGYVNSALGGKVSVFDRNIDLPNGQKKIARAIYFPDIEDGEVKGFYVNVLDVSDLNQKPITNPRDVFDSRIRDLKSVKDILEDVVENLKSHLFDGFPGIELLAKKYFISESKLKRDFKERHGETIFAYYRNLQMELAHDYITSKRANKGQMALILNFSNPSNFSACYHKYIDDLPAKKLINKLQSENDEKHRTFIEQAPFAIAMVDNDLCFLTASRKFVIEYKLQNKDYVGKCLYDLWPRVKEKYKHQLHACLKGNIDHSEGDLIEKIDGSLGRVRWDIRPWYKSDTIIGGLLIYTEELTDTKFKEEEHKQISTALHKPNTIARIGTWERDFKNNTGTWSKTLKEILEVPEDFDPVLDDTLVFFKDDASSDMIIKLRKDAIENCTPFDIEMDIITGKGNPIRVRSIGFPEFINGKCEKIRGIFQDITETMSYQDRCNKQQSFEKATPIR